MIVGPPIEFRTLERMLRLGIVLIDDPYPTSIFDFFILIYFYLLGILLRPDIYEQLIDIFDMRMMNMDRRNLTDMLRYFNAQLFEDLQEILYTIPCIRPSTNFLRNKYSFLFKYFE